MITALLTGITMSPWMRAALRYGAITFAVLLFLLAFLRSGERAGRLAERLETMEKANDVQRRMLESAARCPRSRGDLAERRATVRSDAPPGACPPVVAYSAAEQASMAEEVAALPDGAVIAEWLADYAVLRDQARACASR